MLSNRLGNQDSERVYAQRVSRPLARSARRLADRETRPSVESVIGRVSHAHYVMPHLFTQGGREREYVMV